MHAVLTEEQEMLRTVAAQIAEIVTITHPADLETVDRDRGWKAIADGGLLALRARDGAGVPAASGVEAMLVAEAMGAALAPVPFAGCLLAYDLLAAAGVPDEWTSEIDSGATRYAVILERDMRALAHVDHLGDCVAWDAEGATWGVALNGDPANASVARVALDDSFVPVTVSDLTRSQLRTGRDGGWSLEAVPAPLRPLDLDRWTALALVLVSADAVGVMRRGLERAVEYSKERVQYGVPIGSFQAIQHICADMLVRAEATASVTRYAAWAVNALPLDEALRAASTAKAYAARAARDVCEAVMQVFGGIGQTWEHVAHLHTRRALLDGVVFGDEAYHLDRIGAVMVEAG